MGNEAGAVGTESERANAPTQRRRNGPPRYSERLYVPWWGWPLPLIGGGLLAAEVHMGYPGVRAWLPYLIVLPVVVGLLLSFGRTKIAVTEPEGAGEAELCLGDAHLPVGFVNQVEVIDRQHKRQALGPGLDPAAFVVHRGWVGPLLRVTLADPNDPTPYWLFSTRHPNTLADALRRIGSAETGAENTDGATESA